MNKAIYIAVLAMFLSYSTVFAQTDDEADGVGPTGLSSSTDTIAEDRLAVEQIDRNGSAARGLVPTRAFQRRLPSGYGPIVDANQRSRIYQIQEEYHEAIAILEMRLELLKKERDAKIEGILTPNQLERVRRPARILPLR